MTPRPVAITGANSGVGFEASRQLAALGVPVVLICRSEARGREAIARIVAETAEARLDLELCDLGDLTQVRALADRVRTSASNWGALVNNAGLYRARLEQTDDGLERTLAVNHLGHYLLTRLLEDELRSAGARIVNVSSQGHTRGQLRRRPLEDILTAPADYNGIQAYCDSKLCNVLFMRELVRRWGDDVTSTAVHPGVLATAIWDRERTLLMGLIRRFVKPFMDSPETGGRAVATLAADPTHADTTDAYFRRQSSARPAPMANDRELADELWQLSERLVGL